MPRSILRLSIFTLLIFIFLVTSCSKEKRPVIGFMLPHTTVKRYLIEKEEFSKKVKELGGDVIFMSADNDEEKQAQQVKELLKKDIDVLVLDPVNRFRAAEMVRAAHDKGIPVVSYDRLVANCDVDAFLTFDASAIGSKMATFALNHVPNGKYIILAGDKSDMNAILINDAIQKTLAPAVKAAKIHVVYQSFIERYSAEEAEYHLQKYIDLTMEEPDVILCAGDLLAKGAITALQKLGIEKEILITGQNADINACQEILKGNQAITIYKPVKKLAHLAAEISVNLARGQKTDAYFKGQMYNGAIEVPSTFLDVIVVDASNINSTVIADGFITEAELNGK